MNDKPNTAGRAAYDDPNRPPGVNERYATATSHGGQRDIVAAAGMIRRDLGVALLRVSAEFDAVRGTIRRASDAAQRRAAASTELLAHASRLEARAGKMSERALMAQTQDVAELLLADGEKCQRQAEKARAAAADALRRAPGEILAERIMVLDQLTTLDTAAAAVRARAIVLNTKRGQHALPNDQVMRLAAKVLDVFLDEACPQCDGTGRKGSAYVGHVGEACAGCRGTGHRRDTIGNRQDHRDFARDVLADLQRATADAAAAMRRALAGPGVSNVEAAAGIVRALRAQQPA